MQRKNTIFDRIMLLPGLKVFNPFYQRYKEMLLYLFFGGVTFVLNLVMFSLLHNRVGLNELVANVICWVICVLVQFFTNRKWVFNSTAASASSLIYQMGSFFGGRVFTLIVEEIILAVFITWLHFNSMLIKIVAQVVVILLNYIISKYLVFSEKSISKRKKAKGKEVVFQSNNYKVEE